MILRVLHALHGAVERLDGPVLVEVGPGELVELDEVDAHRVDLEDVLVHRRRDRHRAVARALVVQVVRRLGQHLHAGVLHLRRLAGGPLQRPRLLDHDRAVALDLVRRGARVQAAVDREAEVAAVQVVAEPAVVVVEGLVGVVVAVQPAVADDVEARVLLVGDERGHGVLERLLVERVRWLLVAVPGAHGPGVPPARVGVVADHRGGDEDLPVADAHLAPSEWCGSQTACRVAGARAQT